MATWRLTVATERTRREAISLLVAPAARRATTSASRGVRPSACGRREGRARASQPRMPRLANASAAPSARSGRSGTAEGGPVVVRQGRERPQAVLLRRGAGGGQTRRGPLVVALQRQQPTGRVVQRRERPRGRVGAASWRSTRSSSAGATASSRSSQAAAAPNHNDPGTAWSWGCIAASTAGRWRNSSVARARAPPIAWASAASEIITFAHGACAAAGPRTSCSSRSAAGAQSAAPTT